MSSTQVLVVYGTTEGHTRLIAGRVANWIQAEGHQVSVVDSAAKPADLDVRAFDAYVLLGSLHETKHQASLVHFVKDSVSALSSKPSLFISASLTATNPDDKHQSDARRCMEQFYEDTGWTPTASTPVAGALLYTQYNFLKRMLLKFIVSREGGDVDTSKDYEYTDWDALHRFVSKFCEEHLPVKAAAAR